MAAATTNARLPFIIVFIGNSVVYYLQFYYYCWYLQFCSKIKPAYLTKYPAKYTMKLQNIQIQYDVHCEWLGQPPVYRLYVNDELFTERTYIWQDQYLEEVVPIDAVAGDYVIRYELAGTGTLTATNPRVNHGAAHFVDNYTLRIANEDA